MKKILVLFLLVIAATACSPEIGSTQWCKKMDAKPSGEWTINEAKDYATNCLFKSGDQE